MKDIKNFGIIHGKAKIKNGQIVYKESDNIVPNNEKAVPYAEIRSDVNFSNGKIEFKVKFKSYQSGCLILQKFSDGKDYLIGYSRDWGRFVLPNDYSYQNSGSLSGSLENYDLNEEIVFRIEALGSVLKLYINNVLMINAIVSLLESPITFRISGEEIIISEIKYEIIKPKVFIVMQFTPEYNELYNEVIKPVCESYNLECIRADEFYTSTPIIKDIIDSIKNSYIIIAEITPDNPNVFYEIVYAHAINKPTILLCDKKREKLPFDVSGFRTLFYENSIGGKSKVERDLKKFIEGILK